MLVAAIAILAYSSQPGESERPWLDAALDVERWLASCVIETEHGLTWPVVPAESPRSSMSLYSGSPGVVLFYIELFEATNDQTYLEIARRGAEQQLEAVSYDDHEAGLYTGLAGVGFTLLEVFEVTRADDYRAGAMFCMRQIEDAALEVGAGVQWNDSTDIISGSAGIGMFLLRIADHLAIDNDHETTIELATRIGDRLIELGEPTDAGMRWRMAPDYARRMPNFSHGTAGVATFLSELYAATKEDRFRAAAEAGARHLVSIAGSDLGFCVHHHEPGGEKLYYLGWCHGPPGTARLFRSLARSTGSTHWLENERNAARALLESGIPARRTDGFWNNVGVCCGSAGVGEFMLEMFRAYGNGRHLALARELTVDLLERGTRSASGLEWSHAEHRMRPELLQSQTGYMQGASGIGLWLLHLDAFEQRRPRRIRLPDDPY